MSQKQNNPLDQNRGADARKDQSERPLQAGENSIRRQDSSHQQQQAANNNPGHSSQQSAGRPSQVNAGTQQGADRHGQPGRPENRGDKR